MRNISKLAYLLGLPVLAGMFVIGFMNVAMGSVFISIPSSMDLHRPQLKKLLLGATSNGASVEVDVENNRLNIANGLVMGQNNVVAATAKFVSIGGGVGNILNAVEKSGIGGGSGNEINSSFSVIGGGENNLVAGTVDGVNAIAGGLNNSTSAGGTVVGGLSNQVSGIGVVVGGQGNESLGDGSMVFGNNSKGGARSFSWNSSIAKEDSAIIMTDKGTLVGTYDPVTGVNLVVEGAVKIGTGLLSGNIGEIRMQSGCFYGYDGGMWRVINKKSGDGCPKVVCSVGSFLLQPGDSMQVYRQPYSLNCSNALQTGYCNADGTFGTPGVQYYAYCYELSGGTWSAEETAECGSANGRVYVNSPTASDGLCARGSYSSIDNQNTIFAWTCTNGSSVVNCSTTRMYSCVGDQPTGPGVVMGSTTQVYSDTLKSWTPVAQGVSPGVCQWTCAEGYEQQANGCSGDVINEPGGCGTYNPSDFEDLDMYFLTNDGATGHYTLMDRNLGATQVYSGVNNVCTYGYFYQWGNNYGFATIGTINIAYNKQVNASGYGPGNYYSSGTFLPQQPWSSVRNDNLWGGVSGTNYAMRGPCPSGYHVPAKHEFVNMINTYWRNSVDNQTPSQFAMDFLMSRAGERNYMHPNEVSGQGSYGHYWYSTHYASMVGGSLAFSYTDQLDPDYNGPASNGKSIRCMKNSPNSILTIYPDGGKKAVIIVHDGKITKLGTPTKDGKTFGGWYSDAGFTSQVHEGDSVPASAELYARWR